MSTINTDDNFVRATRLKLRFETSRGQLSTEDLWDLSLESLDRIAVATDEKLSKLGRQSFIKETRETNEQKEAKLQLEILKAVIETKLEEKEASKVKAAKESQKAFLEELLLKKQQAKMEGLSEDEINAQIAALT